MSFRASQQNTSNDRGTPSYPWWGTSLCCPGRPLSSQVTKKTTEVGRVGGRPGLVTLTSTSLMRGLVHATPARHTPAPSPQQSQQDNWAHNPSLRPLREVEGCFRTTPEPCDKVLGGSGGTRQAWRGDRYGSLEHEPPVSSLFLFHKHTRHVGTDNPPC